MARKASYRTNGIYRVNYTYDTRNYSIDVAASGFQEALEVYELRGSYPSAVTSISKTDQTIYYKVNG